MRVLVIDRSPAYAAGVSGVLSGAGMSVRLLHQGVAAAVRLARDWRPHVCLVGYDVGGGGPRVISALKAGLPTSVVAVLDDSEDAGRFIECLDVGADGYLVRSVDPARMPAIVTALAGGDPVVPRALLRSLVDELRASWRDGVDGPAGVLTPSERRVMGLLRQGLTTREAADVLGVSQATVRTHVGAARRRLGARTRAEAVALVPLYRGG